MPLGWAKWYFVIIFNLNALLTSHTNLSKVRLWFMATFLNNYKKKILNFA